MFRQFLNRRNYEKAADAVEDGEMLCATLVDGKPVYFSMPSEASDDDVRRKAFELREGRGMSATERTLLSLAEHQRS